MTLGDMCAERYDHYAKLHEADDATKYMGTRTGLTTLDDLLIALAPGDFTLLAARPHMGKTALALNIARNIGVDQKGTVGFFSLEMSKEQLFDRMFGSMAGIAPWRIAKGTLSDDKFEKAVQKLEQLEHPRIYIDDDSNHSLTNIRSKARRLHMQHPLDLLIIDYLQLIRVTNRSAQESQNMKLTMISESIKQLARELGVPILALSQMNREADRRPNHKPQLSDLRDSGSLEQDADHVLMLYSEDYYADDDDVDALNTDAPRQIELYVRKNRPQGLTGRVRFDFDKETMNFSSVV